MKFLVVLITLSIITNAFSQCQKHEAIVDLMPDYLTLQTQQPSYSFVNCDFNPCGAEGKCLPSDFHIIHVAKFLSSGEPNLTTVTSNQIATNCECLLPRIERCDRLESKIDIGVFGYETFPERKKIIDVGACPLFGCKNRLPKVLGMKKIRNLRTNEIIDIPIVKDCT